MTKTPTISRAVLAESICEKVPTLSQKEASNVVDAVIRAMKDALAKGDNVMISGFGKFEVKEKASRRGRNPRTGEEITIAARRVLNFKPSEILRERMNEDLS